MQFRTQVEISKSSSLFNHGDQFLLLGSCFSQHIANKLEYYKFDSLLNPFGIVFNPISIANSLKDLCTEKEFQEEDLHSLGKNSEGPYFCFDAHSSLNGIEKEDCLQQLNSRRVLGTKQLKNAKLLVLSIGTAFAFRYLESNKVVANCHKVPSSAFESVYLEVEEMYSALKKSIEKVRELNPKLRVLLTVSPVRHWKNGAVNNQRSKARLHLAIEKLLLEDTKLSYFPSYEIMMDELRDYRFYSSDMLHPSEVAVDYIWERFANVIFDSKTLEVLPKIEKIRRGLEHKPFLPNQINHKKFLLRLKDQMKELEGENPYLSFEKERGKFLRKNN